MRRGWVLVMTLCATVFVTSVSRQAHAEETSSPQPDGPSIISSAWSGLGAGIGIGAGAGYLYARRDGWQKHDWRAVGLGMGIGALSGAGLGLILGVIDKSGAPGGRYVARDMSAGAGFGAVIGVIAGGISAVARHPHKPEHALFGAAIGVVSGAGLGIITGIIEGVSKRNHTVTATSRLHVEPSLLMARQVDHTNLMMPGLSGRF
ncbi:MAG: hypothetical protein JWN04_3344 [Myxococcaceae bacterium]|nr:hypothetical protein [Myxococcaceae bacterium]